MASNTIRFTGIASGLDTEALVKAMLMTQQNKIDKQTRKQQLNTWKQEAWKEMNSKINSFNEKYIDKLKMQTTFVKNKVTTSNDSAISVSENSNLGTGTHKVNITSLASSSYVKTNKVSVKDVDQKDLSISTTTKLSELKDANGQDIITSEITIDVNGKEVKVGPDSTINDLIKGIQKADSNLSVSFDSNNQQFFINSKTTGEVEINISGSSDEAKNLISALGIEANDTNSVKGSLAKYTYNGMAFESSSNKVSVNGIEMTLKAANTGEITIQGTPNTDELVSFMKEFVNEYNSLIDDINKKLTTKTSSDYEPLTDEEKEATTEANVEKIENYVKDGLFYRDSNLISIRDSLRDTLSGVVESNTTYKTLASIGITTGDWKENGKLHFNENTFIKAFKENPDDVINLFTGSGSSSNAIEQYMKKHNVDEATATEQYNKLSSKEQQTYLIASQGIFYRVSNNLSTLSKSSELRSFGSYYNDKILTEELTDIADRISVLNERYTRQETALYKKFTAMEKVMSQLNSQQSYLTNMFSV